MSKYVEDDRLGRKLFKSIINANGWYPILIETEGQFDSWDITLVRTDVPNPEVWLTEIKNRNCISIAYDRKGYFLEKDKLARLQAQYQPGVIPVYVNVFQDGTAYCWNLMYVNEKTTASGREWMNKTTSTGSYKVLKDVFYLHLSDAFTCFKINYNPMKRND